MSLSCFESCRALPELMRQDGTAVRLHHGPRDTLMPDREIDEREQHAASGNTLTDEYEFGPDFFRNTRHQTLGGHT